jgi:hypothetical protein
VLDYIELGEIVTFSYFSLISRDATGQVLLVETPNGLALPELGFPDSNLRFQYVRRFNLFIANQLGLNVTSVGKFRSLPRPDRGADWVDRFYGFEVQSSEQVSVAHTWLGSAELKNARLTDSNHEPIIEAWLEFSQNRPAYGLAAPWRSPGWYRGADEWIRHELVSLGITIVGDIEQIIVWDRSTILRIPTDAGNLYFKACPSAARQEVRVTKWLSPAAIASDARCG